MDKVVATTLAVVTAMREEIPAETVTVSEAPEPQSAPVPDNHKQAAKRQAGRDKYAADCKAMGMTDVQIDATWIKRAIRNGGQRNHPTWATVCSPEMVAFWESHADNTPDGVMSNAVKLIRRDRNVMGDHITAEQVNERISSIRVSVVSAINECRRQAAIAAGTDPTKVKYLVLGDEPVASSKPVITDDGEVLDSDPTTIEAEAAQ